MTCGFSHMPFWSKKNVISKKKLHPCTKAQEGASWSVLQNMNKSQSVQKVKGCF